MCLGPKSVSEIGSGKRALQASAVKRLLVGYSSGRRKRLVLEKRGGRERER